MLPVMILDAIWRAFLILIIFSVKKLKELIGQKLSWLSWLSYKQDNVILTYNGMRLRSKHSLRHYQIKTGAKVVAELQ